MEVCGSRGRAELRENVDWEKKEGLRLRVWVVERVMFDDIGGVVGLCLFGWIFLARFLKRFIVPDLPELVSIGI